MSRVRENLTHGSRRRREETAPVGPGRAASGASRRPYHAAAFVAPASWAYAHEEAAVGTHGFDLAAVGRTYLPRLPLCAPTSQDDAGSA